MNFTRFRCFFALLALLLLWGYPPASVDASNCEANCATEVSCFGGCTLDLPDCGTSCREEGCTVDCNGQNPGGGFDSSCTTVAVHVKCYQPGKDPQPIPQPKSGSRETQWAVVVYTPTPGALPTEDELTIAAASSTEAADQAKMEAAESFGERFGLLIERKVLPPPGVPFRYFQVEPAARCAKIAARLTERKLPFDAPSGTGVFLKGWTDGDGKVTEATVLYSDTTPEAQAALVSFASRNLRVWRTDGPSRPVEFFLFLGSFGKGEAGIALAGGSAIAAEKPERNTETSPER